MLFRKRKLTNIDIHGCGVNNVFNMRQRHRWRRLSRRQPQQQKHLAEARSIYTIFKKFNIFKRSIAAFFFVFLLFLLLATLYRYVEQSSVDVDSLLQFILAYKFCRPFCIGLDWTFNIVYIYIHCWHA